MFRTRSVPTVPFLIAFSFLLSASVSADIIGVRAKLRDKFTKAPISGMAPWWGFGQLYLCDSLGDNCSYKNGLDADANGTLVFRKDSEGSPLPAGTYRIQSASAEQYSETVSRIITVADGEKGNLGSILLKPNAVQFVDQSGCPPFDGKGQCTFEITAANRRKKAFSGSVFVAVWSQSRSALASGRAPLTTWSIAPDAPSAKVVGLVAIDPGQSIDLAFSFAVPTSVPDFSSGCPSYFAKAGGLPLSLTVGYLNAECFRLRPAAP